MLIDLWVRSSVEISYPVGSLCFLFGLGAGFPWYSTLAVPKLFRSSNCYSACLSPHLLVIQVECAWFPRMASQSTRAHPGAL